MLLKNLILRERTNFVSLTLIHQQVQYTHIYITILSVFLLRIEFSFSFTFSLHLQTNKLGLFCKDYFNYTFNLVELQPILKVMKRRETNKFEIFLYPKLVLYTLL